MGPFAATPGESTIEVDDPLGFATGWSPTTHSTGDSLPVLVTVELSGVVAGGAGIQYFDLFVTLVDSTGRTVASQRILVVVPPDPALYDPSASAPALQVELTWTEAGDDLDLHLLRGMGASPRSDDDCYYANCSGPDGLDWGAAGTGPEDPRLVADDIGGTGPEVITIEAPEPGTYVVMVHDFVSTEGLGPNNATVDVLVDGALEASFSFEVTEEDSETWVATIEWPSGSTLAFSE